MEVYESDLPHETNNVVRQAPESQNQECWRRTCPKGASPHLVSDCSIMKRSIFTSQVTSSEVSAYYKYLIVASSCISNVLKGRYEAREGTAKKFLALFRYFGPAPTRLNGKSGSSGSKSLAREEIKDFVCYRRHGLKSNKAIFGNEPGA